MQLELILNKHHTITNHKNTKNDDQGRLLKLWFQSEKPRENLIYTIFKAIFH